MDDLEFRRHALIEPNCQDEGFIQKKNESTDNQKWVEAQQALEYQLNQAVLQVSIPERLSERIILQRTLKTDYQRQSQRRRYVWYALAASLFLTISVLLINLQPAEEVSLNQLALQHVYEELPHLHDQQHKTIDHLNMMLHQYGGTLTKNIGEVNYLGACKIANKSGIHMVLPASKGVVTVMMLPQIDTNQARSFSDPRFQGRIMPTDKGSIVIVGEHGENLQTFQQYFAQNLTWQRS
ncbi:DUF3379 family protein [Candidatus Albibeggiatoa sp. nov. BB20]|uniref:DUF3379 family protein n=1 Tax=Candidatus Albibeggiatoa sp. nov. BB20 TaxID=3162723 RepID=UPI0033656CFE